MSDKNNSILPKKQEISSLTNIYNEINVEKANKKCESEDEIYNIITTKAALIKEKEIIVKI